MKNKKKLVLGAALLTSLTIFAAGSSVNNNARTGSNSAVNASSGQSRVKGGAGMNIERLKELSDKFKKGTATKAEMSEIADFLTKKGRKGSKGGSPENKSGSIKNGSSSKIDPAKLETIRTKLKNGSALTKEEKEIVIQKLERKLNFKDRKNRTNNSANENTTKR